MRLLFCTEFFHSRVGGAERILESLVLEMAGRNHKVTVCSFESSGLCSQCKHRGINHVDFSTLGPFDVSFRAIASVPSFGDQDVIFAQHYYHFSSFFAAMVSRYHRVPLVVKPIGIYQRGIGAKTLIYNGLSSTQGLFCLKAASLVLPTTRFEAKMLEAKGISSERIKVIPSGVEVQDKPTAEQIQEFVRSHGVPDDPLVLFAGRLERLKGIDTLMDAMLLVTREVPKVQCLLAGNEDKKFVSKLLSRKRYESLRLILTGYLSTTELNTVYALSTVFVLPSLSELSSLTLKEAMLAGLPVIATRVGGNPEYVVDNVNGILVEPNKPADLARAIIRLLKDESLRARMGEAAFATASRYSLGSYLAATAEALSQVGEK